MLIPLRPLHHLRGYRPLCYHDDRLYLGHGGVLYASPDHGATLSFDCRLVFPSSLLRAASASRLSRRLTRAGLWRLSILADGTRILVSRGGIYRAASGSSEAQRAQPIQRGSRPTSLACSPSGFACFGEYFSNPERVEVHVYGSADGGLSWHPVYTFPAGSIRHVHAIAYDRWSDCFWMATGDSPGECRLLRASSDFGDIREVLRGDQESRFYRLLPTPDSLITATDSPYAANAITVIDKASGKPRRVQEVENSCFSVCQVGSRFFVATTAEPGGDNDTNHAHIWAGSEDLSAWQRCASLPIDAISSICLLSPRLYGLMQFPRVEFPEGPNPSARHLVAYCTGLRGLDDATIVYEIDATQGSEIR